MSAETRWACAWRVSGSSEVATLSSAGGGFPGNALSRHKTLIDRIDELTTHSQRLADQHRQATADHQQLRQRVTELEDNLTAARTSLRRMIREENRAVSDSPAPG